VFIVRRWPNYAHKAAQAAPLPRNSESRAPRSSNSSPDFEAASTTPTHRRNSKSAGEILAMRPTQAIVTNIYAAFRPRKHVPAERVSDWPHKLFPQLERDLKPSFTKMIPAARWGSSGKMFTGVKNRGARPTKEVSKNLANLAPCSGRPDLWFQRAHKCQGRVFARSW
jgi:hypothetical protein